MLVEILALVIFFGIIGVCYWIVHSIVNITHFGCQGIIIEFFIYALIAYKLGDFILRFFLGAFQVGIVIGIIGVVVYGVYITYNYFKNK